jgi:pyruvate kinase
VGRHRQRGASGDGEGIIAMKAQTKIVATIGPASSTAEVLRELMEAGVDVFRLNFSHGTHEQHSAVVGHIRALSRELDRHVAILQDLCGPKMRLLPVPDDVLDCRLGDEFTLVIDGGSLSAGELACTYRDLPNDVRPGETMLFADGAVAMTVTATEPGRARLRVTLPGRVRSRQGINLPGSDLGVDSLTDKDLADLDWTARHGDDIDFVGLSFVRRAEDVERLRAELCARGCSAQVVVKIEKPQAVQRLDSIVAAADAVMVARGDLGVEMDVHRVPAIQKQIVTACNRAHRPVIIATQMLNSMEHSNRPTRAEAGDVFNAVLDGADAVMLSGESAVGEYPVDSVKTMRHICREAEAFMKASGGRPLGSTAPLSTMIDPITAASADAACIMTEQLDAALIAVVDDSGRTALAVSSRRPAALILSLLRTEQVARRLSLCWGVTAVVLNEATWAERVLAFGVDWARSHGLVTSGERAVLLRGELADRPDVRAVVAGLID